MANRIVQGSDGHYFLASHLTPSCLTYDVSHTHMLSYGFSGQQDAAFAAGDAECLAKALTESSLVEEKNVKLCTSKEQCTSKAIRSAFRSKALSTGENGLLIFAYHGPVEVCSNEWSLFSSNFDLATPSTHITAAVILGWLKELDVKPQKALFFLDCQHASEIANILTRDPLTADLQSVCAFCANTPRDTSLLTSSLQHSVFSYFTAWVFRRVSRKPTQSVKRIIAVKDISERVKDCCSALTSLCVTAARDASAPDVVSVQIQPLILRIQDTRNGHDMIDGGTNEGEDEVDGSVGRFDFLEKHYSVKSDKLKPQLSDESYKWLNWLKHSPTSPLHILRQHGALSDDEVLLTVLRLLLYSTAMIQSNINSAQRSIGEPNLLIMLFVQVVGVVEHVTGREVRADARQFEHSLEAYYHALNLRQVKDSKISKLAENVRKENTT